MNAQQSRTQINEDLAGRAKKDIDTHAMLAKGDRVLMAVSGGPDSVALLHVLMDLAPEYQLNLAVAHLNHGIRPEAAEREARFVEEITKRNGLPFFLHKIRLDPASGSLEERARDHRYAFLMQVAREHGFTRIALGHQADDNAEAVLLNLLRGSATLGMAGIPPVRDLFIRPLIGLRRKEILKYLQSRRLASAEDESNSDLRFARNRVRQRLIPLLEKEFNPGIIEILNRMAALFREEEAWFASFLPAQLDALTIQREPRKVVLSRPGLQSVPRALQRRLLRMALKEVKGDLRRIDAGHIERLVKMIDGEGEPQRKTPGPNRTAHLPDRLVVRWSEAQVCLAVAKTLDHEETQSFLYSIASESDLPAVLTIPEVGCRLSFIIASADKASSPQVSACRSACFDADAIVYPLTIRAFREGDRLSPFGMTGTQKIKKIFIDRKIPRPLRRRIPLLISADRHILWVAGLRRGRRAPVTPHTHRILRIDYDEGSPSDRI